MDIMNGEEYKTWIGGIARRFKQSQIKAATAVNVEMLKFYWSLGADIVRLEKDQPWGSRFMQRVSADLKTWMPEAKCFSPTNLKYMRRTWQDGNQSRSVPSRLCLPSLGTCALLKDVGT